jgi:hypothetical protein
MSRLSRATYSLMVSLLPATATVVGILVLAQIPTTPELLGVVLVVLAVAAHRERSDPTASRVRDEVERHQRLQGHCPTTGRSTNRRRCLRSHPGRTEMQNPARRGC